MEKPGLKKKKKTKKIKKKTQIFQVSDAAGHSCGSLTCPLQEAVLQNKKSSTVGGTSASAALSAHFPPLAVLQWQQMIAGDPSQPGLNRKQTPSVTRVLASFPQRQLMVSFYTWLFFLTLLSLLLSISGANEYNKLLK